MLILLPMEDNSLVPFCRGHIWFHSEAKISFNHLIVNYNKAIYSNKKIYKSMMSPSLKDHLNKYIQLNKFTECYI